MASTIQARWVFGLIALACALAIAAALYLQHVVGLEPCPLCIFQRIWSGLVVLVAAAGGVVSVRHVWLQHLPADKVPACGPGLDYMISTLPFSSMLDKVFKGSGECAVVDWTFLGLSLPELTGAFFLAVIATCLWLLLRKR